MRTRLARLFTLLVVVLTIVALAMPATVPAARGGAAPATSAKKKKKKATCKKKSTKKSKHKKKSCAKHKKKKRKKKIGVPGTPAPPAALDLRPRDYTKITGLTQPVFTNIEKVTQMLPMADGTDIYLEISKPKGQNNLGVILEASPYHGTIYPRTGTRILPLPLGKDGNPLGLVGYFPPRGYAVVMMDLRGTGKSAGCLDHLGPKDQSDLKEVIEWAAKQPWSNGRVGMLGHSYVGSTPIIATKLNPKGLVTIVPSAGLPAMYDHQFQAGVPFNLQWAGPIEAYLDLSIIRELPPGLNSQDDPSGLVIGGETGDDFGNHPQDTLCGAQQSAITAGPASQYFGQEAQWHKDRDAAKEAAAWPGHVFLVHGTHDQAARISNMYWFTARHRDGDKLFIGQWDHGIGCCPNQRGIQWTEALHAWFDRQLLMKDVDTGPPVEAYLNDNSDDATSIGARKEIVTAAKWPLPSHMADFSTAASGALDEGAPGGGGSVTFTGDPQGFSDPDATGNVAFMSKPFTKDMLFLGTPTLDLSVSTIGQRTDLIVNVYDVSGDGSKRRLSQFAMNPLLRNGIDQLAPVTPGQQMSLKPPGFPMAHHLKPGHVLMLRVQVSDPDKVPFGGIDPQVTVFYGQGGTILHVPDVDEPTYFPDTAPRGSKPAGGATARAD
jgi:uncharacterized protein